MESHTVKGTKMTLTSEQVQTITRHLAEKVMGWELVWSEASKMPGYSDYWIIPSMGIRCASCFNPLTDPRDASLVMEAWNVDAREFTISTDCDAPLKYHAWAGDVSGDVIVSGSGDGPSWIEAVSIAIFRASGGTL